MKRGSAPSPSPRAPDLQRRLQHYLERGPRGATRPVLAQPAKDVLDVDDRVVDDLADGDGEAPERQRVEREPQAVEHDDRPQQREGDRRERDERRAQVEEEDEEDDRDEDAAEEQRLHDVVDGGLHEAGGPEERRVERNALAREGGRHLVERALHGLGDLLGVLTELARQHEQHAGVAVDGAVADLRLRGVQDVRHVAQPQDRALAVRQDRLAELGGGEALALGPEDDALGLGFHESGAAHPGRPPGGREHIVDREAVAEQPLGAHLDLHLAHLAAEHDDLGDTGHSEQPRPERPVGERAEIHQGARPGREPDDEDETRGRRGRHHRGRVDTLRQLPGQGREPLADQLASLEDPGPFPEGRGDDREPLDRLRPDRLEAPHPVHGGLDRAGNERLHLFR